MPYRRHVQRFKGGFVFGQFPVPRNWSSGWEYQATSRPLVYCHLQILLAGFQEPCSRLIIHPTLSPTPFFPLTQSLPLPSGTPITLLPYGIPAYYHNTYAGPTSALIKQFKDSLQGLGISNWEDIFNRYKDADTIDNESSQTPTSQKAMFVIAQINVENKQGANKGLLVIYPTALCLSFVPSMANPRHPSEQLLDLPIPLQPSPQVQPAIPSGTLPDGRNTMFYSSSQARNGIKASSSFSSPLTSGSPTSDSIHAFRSLMLSKHKDIYRVADEVGVYVESVAKDREKERERLKREREGASASPRMSRNVVPTPNAAPATPVVNTPESNQSHNVQAIESSVVPQQHTASLPSVNSSYPSPPHVNSTGLIVSEAQISSPVDAMPSPLETTPPPPIDPQQPPAEPPAQPKPSNTTFDPFGNMNTTWSQSSQSYMDMDIGFGMEMDFNMDAISSSGHGRDAYLDRRNDMDFESAFTDDDFSFFDQPTRQTVPSRIMALNPQLSTPGIIPDLSTNDILGKSGSLPLDPHLSGPGPPDVSCSWSPGTVLEGLLPAFTEIPETSVPALTPPSPGRTPDTISGPATPNVQLEGRLTALSVSSPQHVSPFDPIPFAPYHRLMDGKYLYGKFSISSSRNIEDTVESYQFFGPSLSEPGWRSRYNAVTDPRIGVVRKLIGVKRKFASEHGPRDDFRFPPLWMQEHEEWDNKSSKSDSEENLSDEDSEDGDQGDIDSIHDMSRPVTPPPPYLPLGPSLLCSHFEHSVMLPLGTPLRSTDPVGSSNANPSVSVPTPVSPAATFGAATEKSKSLEAVASTIATEVVENNLWAEAWRYAALSPSTSSGVWPADVKYAFLLLGSVAESGTVLSLNNLYELRSSIAKGLDSVLKPLESPMIAVAKGDSVIHVLPTALRFWEKLGLGPRGGKKDVATIILYDNEDDNNQRKLQVDAWLKSIAATYASKHYGTIEPVRTSHCPKDGHLPVRYDSSFRKSLLSVISNLPTIEQHYVFLLVLPISIMTLASPVLRQVIAAMKKILKDHPNITAVYHLIPEYTVFGPPQTPSAHEVNVNTICSLMYNRTPAPVFRTMSRKIFADDFDDVKSYIEEPAFALARPLNYKASFVRAAHASLGVIDRHTFIHVGYQVSTCGKWLLASCIDQRGEAHDLGVWLTHTPCEGDDDVEASEDLHTVRKIWEFALSFARRADVEWRMVITKLGTMGEGELSTWTHYLQNQLAIYPFPALHVSLLCTEIETSWWVVETQCHPSKATNRATSSKGSVFTDSSSQTYLLHSKLRLPISLPTRLSFSHSLIPEPSSQSSSSSAESPPGGMNDKINEDRQPVADPAHPLTMIPQSSITLVRIPASEPCTSTTMLHVHLLYTILSSNANPPYLDDSKLHEEIAYNFYELSLLAKVRWKLNADPKLPFHLGAVEAMRIALERDRDRLDAATDS
ncbi:hypothetical protein AMATHDRAFT_192998 [Amanita thiersii Skay4041]|uniref:Mediator of RNA polymerase II transcription subunit 13 n=1 Tax=Amanita thiersii Skay4041 TaxID=703135 RepID=A0A2A9NHU2_9AGAR|nr:hypothetical protein AMATHDRAFT_192998 [Amanita thiersii Skay4041]